MDDLIDVLIQDIRGEALKSKVEIDRACTQMMRDLHAKNPELMKAKVESIENVSFTILFGEDSAVSDAEVRKAGGDVVRTAGQSPYHATLTGLAPEQISTLLTPTVPNPGRKRR